MTITGDLAVHLEGLLGPDRIQSSEAERARYGLAGILPAAVARPASAEEVAEVVRLAARENLAVVCCGSRSKLEIGMPPQRYDIALDLTGLRGIAHYDPADLTLSVDTGLPLGELSKVLATKGQFLPLAAPFVARATIGGTVASGIDSLSRLQYGTARDFLIGAEFVNGTGHLCKSGGRVVKNVTGYDIHKLMIGSFGTLAAITRLNFRTFPLPELQAGVLTSFGSLEAGLGFRKNLLKSGLPFASVELFDSEFASLAAERLKLEELTLPAKLLPADWFVYVAFGGNEAVVRRLHRELRTRAAQCEAKEYESLEMRVNNSLNGTLRETLAWLRQSPQCLAVLRIVQAQLSPGELTDLMGLNRLASKRRALLLGGCSNALVAFLSGDEGPREQNFEEALVTELMERGGGPERIVTLLHGAASLRARCRVWGAPPGDLALMRRLKAAFDPQNVFSPGRFVGGI